MHYITSNKLNIIIATPEIIASLSALIIALTPLLIVIEQILEVGDFTAVSLKTHSIC
jgi:hypothetical protein